MDGLVSIPLSKYRTLPSADFLWLVQQHFLPKGIRRACNFGYLHSKCKRLFALLQGAEVRSGPVSGLGQGQGTGADTYEAWG
jgi:hypothetical protein